MKKIFFIFAFFVLFISEFAQANININSNICGRWAEKISERVVMDIYSDKNNKEYRIFITWREDNLAQKDIYRFKAKRDNNGNLKYKNGTHIYRYYINKNDIEDKLDYTDGTGIIKIKDDKLIWIDNKDKTETEFIRANSNLTKDTTIKNKLFSITLPEELKGLYEIKKQKDKISIFHKDSKNLGYGGFTFGIKGYKNPEDHATLPGSTKLGELTDKKGNLYDIVLKYPTDVQYDYTKSPEAPESYMLIYNLGNYINIQGINGSTYFKNQGTKGSDLYGKVIKKHIVAIEEKWDSNKLEKENMSPMYNVLSKTNKSVLNKIGYAYYDINQDGIDELLIGEIANKNQKSAIYDIYTMVNRKPKHVISGWSRNRYYICDDSFICNEYSSGALESGIRVYILVENSTTLYPQVGFKYDGYTKTKNPWFISYGNIENDQDWESVSEKSFKERKKTFEKYERFNFIPLKTFKYDK